MELIVPILLYVLFMGIVYIPQCERYFDYDKSVFIATLWYTVGIVIVSFFLFSLDVSLASVLYLVGTFIALVAPTILFAEWWQVHGRPHMPKTKLSERITTFYEFTPRFSYTKLLEVLFQDVCAIAFILLVHDTFQSDLLTVGGFGLVFILVHIAALKYYDKFWSWLIFAAVFLALAIAPVILYLEIGYSLLYLAHMLSYVGFLLLVRKKQL